MTVTIEFRGGSSTTLRGIGSSATTRCDDCGASGRRLVAISHQWEGEAYAVHALGATVCFSCLCDQLRGILPVTQEHELPMGAAGVEFCVVGQTARPGPACTVGEVVRAVAVA